MRRGVYSEDYGRQKDLYNKSLFPGTPLLSPVPEENSQLLLSSSSVESWRRNDGERRAWSPLPPLIIERERKVNRHDEPEEYYQRLARKMRELYRKLFIDNRSLDTSFESMDESLIPTPVKTRHTSFVVEAHRASGQRTYSSARFEDNRLVELELTVPNKNEETNNVGQPSKRSTGSSRNESESQQDYNLNISPDDDDEVISPSSDINRDSSGVCRTENQFDSIIRTHSRSSLSSSRTYRYEVACRAEVHREPSGEYGVSAEGDSQCDDTLLERTRFSETIPKTPLADPHTREMEEMRSQRESGARTSLCTTPQLYHESSSEHASPEGARHSHITEDIHSYTFRTCSDDFNVTLQGSTPKVPRKRRFDDNESSEKKITPKRVRYETVATQSDKIPNWNFFLSNFFIGTPRIFKLCSCRDHRCGC